MSRLAAVFDRSGPRRGAVLAGYLPAGFPSFGGCIAALTAMVDAGVEVVEVGLPYGDPFVDTPVLAEAAAVALRWGIRTRDVLRTVEAVAATGAATLVVTYWNPVERRGVTAFARDLAAAGGAGLVTVDLPPEEAEEWLAASDEYRLDRVFLVAPASSDARIKVATAACRGLVQASIIGTAGSGATAADLIARVRAQAGVPVGVGPGVSTAEQAGEVARYADAVVVSSAFVRRLLDAPDEATGVRQVRALAGELAGAARSARQARPGRAVGSDRPPEAGGCAVR